MTDNTTNIREVVLDVLLEVLENHNLSHIVLKQALEKYLFLERQDRAFITRCVEGTLEYRIQIDAVLDRFSKVKTDHQPLLQSSGKENETGDPGDPQNVGLPDSVYGACTGLRGLQ